MITGQVGLVPSNGGWASGVVALATNSRWTHMVVAINERECMSAEPGGARIRPISYYPDTVWSKYPLRPSQRRRIVRYALSRRDTPYAWVDYLAVAFTFLTGANAPAWLRSYVEGTDSLLCSQLCDLALQAGGIHVFLDHRPAGAVVPASFAKAFIARGWTNIP